MSDISTTENLAALLHTAARRYCKERHTYWTATYSKLVERGDDRTGATGQHYTDKAKDIFPRYNVLVAVLAAIETLDAEKLGSLSEARKELVAAVASAYNTMSACSGYVETAAMADERKRAIRYISKIDDAHIRKVQPMPFRRTVPPHEIQQLFGELKSRWKVEELWGTLPAPDKTAPRLIMDAETFTTALTPDKLQIKLREMGVEQLYELREHDGSRSMVIAVELLDPFYDGAEGYWFTSSKDWILHACHEGSITAVGAPLIGAIETIWPECRQHLWTPCW